jgi:Zn-dependent protease
MLRTGSHQLARIFGIRIGVSTSWFFVVFVMIWTLTGPFHTELGGSNSTAFIVAVGAVLLFFASLILHELGHALAARRLGIQIERIDLWFFGGIARMPREPDTPGGELAIAAAGPLVTLAVSAVLIAIGVAVGGAGHFADVALYRSGVHATALLLLLAFVAQLNILILVFNLGPAWPLDGGRIARAVAWKLTGDRGRATRASARVGQGLAYLLYGFGLAILFLPRLSDRFGVATGLFTILLGFFLNQAAKGALIQTAFSERIRDVTVADIMDREPVTIPADMTLLQAQEEFFARYRWPWFAVVDADGHYLGLLRSERVEQEIAAGRPALTAGEVADDEPPWRINADLPLEALLGSEGLRRLGAVVAVDSDGVLRGVVTLAHVRRALTPTTGAAR